MLTHTASQIKRRSFLKIAGVTAGAALASGCAALLVDTKQQTVNANAEHMDNMSAVTVPAANSTASVKPKPFQTYDATLPIVAPNPTKQVVWESSDVVQYIAKDIAFQAWTFGGNAP